MIQPQTKLKIIDNTGAKIIQCFQIIGGTRKKYARLGDVFVASVKKAEPRKVVKKHDIVRAVVVRQRKEFRRKDGSYIRFDDNAAVILDAKTKNPKGGRISGPIALEIKEKGYDKIATIADELV